MCDGDDGALAELLPNGLLDEGVAFEVDGRRGLVQDEDVGLSEESSSQADQLALADTVWRGGGEVMSGEFERRRWWWWWR